MLATFMPLSLRFFITTSMCFSSILPAAYREGKSDGTWLSHSSSKSQVLDVVETLRPCLLFLKHFSPNSILPSTHHTQQEVTQNPIQKNGVTIN